MDFLKIIAGCGFEKGVDCVHSCVNSGLFHISDSKIGKLCTCTILKKKKENYEFKQAKLEELSHLLYPRLSPFPEQQDYKQPVVKGSKR